MLGQLNFDGKNKVEVAIEILQAFEPKEGYFLGFSGGKDSVVANALCDMAGVKYDAHYSVTSVDPPELNKQWVIEEQQKTIREMERKIWEHERRLDHIEGKDVPTGTCEGR